MDGENIFKIVVILFGVISGIAIIITVTLQCCHKILRRSSSTEPVRRRYKRFVITESQYRGISMNVPFLYHDDTTTTVAPLDTNDTFIDISFDDTVAPLDTIVTIKEPYTNDTISTTVVTSSVTTQNNYLTHYIKKIISILQNGLVVSGYR